MRACSISSAPPRARTIATRSRASAREAGVAITELSTHLQGQLVAVHPAYDELFDAFAPDPAPRQSRGAHRVGRRSRCAWPPRPAAASGCNAHATFSGALMWHIVYPWPQRPAGLVEEGFAELARRWKPMLDVFDENGVDACYEIHPGEDLHDGVTFERFLDAREQPPARQHPLRSQPLRAAAARLPGVHRHLPRADQAVPREGRRVPPERAAPASMAAMPTGQDRPGRFRSLGDGQVDFAQIFSASSPSTATTAGRCSNGNAASSTPNRARAEGAPFIAQHMIRKAERRSTISPAPGRMQPATGGCWGSTPDTKIEGERVLWT